MDDHPFLNGNYAEMCTVIKAMLPTKMKLAQKIEGAFATRSQPAEVRLADEVLQLDSDVEEALWFSGRDWHGLTWEDWQAHSSAIFFFDSEAFAYYLPSMLLLSAQNRTEALTAADSMINQLDRSPDAAGWTKAFATRFLGLHPAELDVLKSWLLQVCEYPAYARWGIAAAGPGDAFGRAYDTVDLLQKEVERMRAPGG